MSESLLAKSGLRERALTYLEQHWVRCVLLVLLAALVHLPALPGQLIWDDSSLVRDNPFTKSPILILETFRHSLDPSSPHYRPVQVISYGIDYLLWDTDTYGYHLTNLLLHLASSVFLYFLLLRLLQPLGMRFVRDANARLLPNVAFLIALFWAVHPVHSAAVDYISGRADSLAFFFSSGAWLSFLRARGTRSFPQKTALYLLAALSALMALCSRESACMWMLLFLFYLFAFDRISIRRAKWIITAACLSLVAVYGGLRQLPTRNHKPSATTGVPLTERGVLMLRALGDYTRLMILPANLHVERTVQTGELAPNAGWRATVGNQFLTILGLLSAAVLTCGALRRGPAQLIRVFGVVWFILTYLPISNLFRLNATVAEHWLYLPSVGFLIFITGCCLDLPLRARRALVVAFFVALVGLGARSYVRSGDWLSPETFYRHSLGAGAAKVRMALNLGQIYAARGDYAKAEPLLRKVVSMNPDYPMGQNALAHLLLRQGKREEAGKVFAVATGLAEQTRGTEQRTWIAPLNVAYMHYSARELDAALAVLQEARANYPGIWPLLNLEAEVLQAMQRTDEALLLVGEFSRANWWHAPSALALGRIFLVRNRLTDAEVAFRHASHLDVHDAESLSLIAQTYLRANRLDEACAMQRRALARQPNQPRQYLLLSDILEKMGRKEEAGTLLAEVSRLQAMANAGGTLN